MCKNIVTAMAISMCKKENLMPYETRREGYNRKETMHFYKKGSMRLVLAGAKAESGGKMNRKKEERIKQQMNLDKFNSITQKVKPENQNQTHNVREEGIAPKNQKR